MLLFLKNVESIEVYKCLENQEPELLCQALISNISKEMREKRKLKLLSEILPNKVKATSYEMEISIKKKENSVENWRLYVGKGQKPQKGEEVDFEDTRAMKFQAGVAVKVKVSFVKISF